MFKKVFFFKFKFLGKVVEQIKTGLVGQIHYAHKIVKILEEIKKSKKKKETVEHV